MRAAALAAAVALVLLLLGWRLWPGPGPAPAQGAVTMPAGPGLGAPDGDKPAAAAPVETPARAALPPSRDASAATARAAAPEARPRKARPALAALAASAAARDHWDLCGVGVMPVAPGSPESLDLPAPLGRHAADLWRPRWLAALHAGNARQRAAAALMAAAAPDAAPGADAEATRTVAQLARDSGDPVLMAWLASRCHASEGCADWPVDAWRRREPDNLAAWADWAQRSGSSEEAFLAGVAQATRVATYPGTLPAAVLGGLPAGMPRYLRVSVALEAWGAEVKATGSPLMLLIRPCAGRALDLPDRRGRCDALARLLLDQGDDWHAVAVAGVIGRYLGWPKATTDSIQLAVMRASLANMSDVLVVQPFTCPVVDRMERRILETGLHGAVPRPRPWVAPPPAAGLRR